MNKAQMTLIAVLTAAGLGLAGCDVDQTEKGEMPDVDVSGGKLPEVEVTPPDVTVGTDKATVEVPTDIDVETEEKTVTVPDVDIDPAEEHEQ